MTRNRKSTFRPMVEALEERAVPANISFTWDSQRGVIGEDSNWSNSANWLADGKSTQLVPGDTTGDDVTIDHIGATYNQVQLTANSHCRSLNMPATDELQLDLHGHNLTVGENDPTAVSAVANNLTNVIANANPANAQSFLYLDNGSFTYDMIQINGSGATCGQMTVRAYDGASLSFGSDLVTLGADLYSGYTPTGADSTASIDFLANTNTIATTHSALTRVNTSGGLTYRADTVTGLQLSSAGNLVIGDGASLTTAMTVPLNVTGGTAYIGISGTVTVTGNWVQSGGTLRLGANQAAAYSTLHVSGSVTLISTTFDVDVNGSNSSTTSDRLVCNSLSLNGGGADTLSVHTYNFGGTGQSLNIIDTNNNVAGDFAVPTNWNGGHPWTRNWATGDLTLL